MCPIYKYSKYNINIEIDNNRKIIYNSFSQAVSVLERDEVLFFNDIMERNPDNLSLDEKKSWTTFSLTILLCPLT